MPKKPRGVLIAGNWKMNHTLLETEGFFTELRSMIGSLQDSERVPFQKGDIQAALFPSFLSLQKALALAEGFPIPITVGAQNARGEEKGAFTGEISGVMLNELEISSCLIGHSERRQYFKETDESVRDKVFSLIQQNFQIILCVGETQTERENGQTQAVLKRQIEVGLSKLEDDSFSNKNQLIIAYEPVWAIGTGLTATPEQAEESHGMIRQLIEADFGKHVADHTSILYGGSVTPENAEGLLRRDHIDGALVGGASLKAKSYFELLKSALLFYR